VKPPRTIFLKWPQGHPFGKPFNILQQKAVLINALDALHTINKPGEIIDIPLRWEKDAHDYSLRNVFFLT
jgi:D-proline reductase (dithiol) PrdB